MIMHRIVQPIRARYNGLIRCGIWRCRCAMGPWSHSTGRPASKLLGSRNANRAQGGGDVLCQLWLKSDRFKNHVTQGWGLLQPSHGLAWQKICHPGYLFLGARARVTSVPCGVSLALAMWLEIIRTYRGNMYIYYVLMSTHHCIWAHGVRAIFVLRIFRLRIFESKFRSRCAKKLDAHEENPPSLFQNLIDSNSRFRDS